MEEQLHKYIQYFRKLNRGYNKGFGKAPHKPILLLAIIKLAERALLSSPKLFITPDLVLNYKNLFKNLVRTGHWNNFALPFFHMRSEAFYRLKPNPGMEASLGKAKSTKSLNKLKSLVAGAEIDRALFYLLQDERCREVLKQEVLGFYFPDRVSFKDTLPVENEIEHQILNEPGTNYVTRLKQLRLSLDKDELEEEVYIRNGIFKKTVPRIYENTCSISGLHLQTVYNVQLVDACHIIPFSHSQDDTITNGICLEPTLHRAFDRGLLHIDADFRVKVSPSLKSRKTNEFLLKYDQNRIKLPENPNYFPAQEALEWHRREVFRG